MNILNNTLKFEVDYRKEESSVEAFITTANP